MKIGVNIKIDVTKLDKARFFQGKKGTYVDLTAFIDPDNPGQYGDHGSVSQKGDKGEKMPIVGNVKMFWRDENQTQGYGQSPASSEFNAPADDLDSIPF